MHQRGSCLFFDANSDQLPLVAGHIHLCFQARNSNQSHLATHSGLQRDSDWLIAELKHLQQQWLAHSGTGARCVWLKSCLGSQLALSITRCGLQHCVDCIMMCSFVCSTDVFQHCHVQILSYAQQHLAMYSDISMLGLSEQGQQCCEDNAIGNQLLHFECSGTSE